MRKAFVGGALAMTTVLAYGQTAELVRPVDDDQARRVEEYNSSFIKEQTYFASRYRIVEVDVDAVVNASEISLTPFDDVKPINLVRERLERNGEDIVFWKGRYESDPVYAATGSAMLEVTITMTAWDEEPAGTVVISALNRFAYSPQWKINELDEPFLDGEGVVGEAPQTPQEIAYHKRLLSLRKHVFFSVSAGFDDPSRDAVYALQPLKYTPRYSLLYEVIRSTAIPFRIDISPGESEFRTEAERILFERYKATMDALPKDDQKQVLGDIE